MFDLPFARLLGVPSEVWISFAPVCCKIRLTLLALIPPPGMITMRCSAASTKRAKLASPSVAFDFPPEVRSLLAPVSITACKEAAGRAHKSKAR